jgi:hypothetical protein
LRHDRFASEFDIECRRRVEKKNCFVEEKERRCQSVLVRLAYTLLSVVESEISRAKGYVVDREDIIAVERVKKRYRCRGRERDEGEGEGRGSWSYLVGKINELKEKTEKKKGKKKSEEERELYKRSTSSANHAKRYSLSLPEAGGEVEVEGWGWQERKRCDEAERRLEGRRWGSTAAQGKRRAAKTEEGRGSACLVKVLAR